MVRRAPPGLRSDQPGLRTGLVAATPDELRKALEKAFTVGGPVIIEVPVGERMPSPWKFIIMEQNRKRLCT